jgi:hypothetical protein
MGGTERKRGKKREREVIKSKTPHEMRVPEGKRE